MRKAIVSERKRRDSKYKTYDLDSHTFIYVYRTCGIPYRHTHTHTSWRCHFKPNTHAQKWNENDEFVYFIFLLIVSEE